MNSTTTRRRFLKGAPATLALFAAAPLLQRAEADPVTPAVAAIHKAGEILLPWCVQENRCEGSHTPDEERAVFQRAREAMKPVEAALREQIEAWRTALPASDNREADVYVREILATWMAETTADLWAASPCERPAPGLLAVASELS